MAKPFLSVCHFTAADVEEIKQVVNICLSGALSYELRSQIEPSAVTIRVLKNGSY